MCTVIDSFSGKHAFLSNFYSSPYQYAGYTIPTVEHGYQAGKAISADDWLRIIQCSTPGAAKRLGRNIQIHKNWEHMKVNVMLTHLRLKFANPELKRMLLDTGDATLIEGNWWGDRFWGVCKGEGKNMLGTLLMNLRAVYAAEEVAQ